MIEVADSRGREKRIEVYVVVVRDSHPSPKGIEVLMVNGSGNLWGFAKVPYDVNNFEGTCKEVLLRTGLEVYADPTILTDAEDNNPFIVAHPVVGNAYSSDSSRRLLWVSENDPMPPSYLSTRLIFDRLKLMQEEPLPRMEDRTGLSAPAGMP